jgi:hypothetical protein
MAAHFRAGSGRQRRFRENVQETEQRNAGGKALEQFDRNRRVVEDFTERTLAFIPSEFGRLLYLASLRNLATGSYSHAGLEAVYSREAVQEALAVTHRSILERILQLPLEQQLTDLRRCLGTSGGREVGAVAGRWNDVQFYRSMLPLGIPEAAKDLFCSNLAAVLYVIETESPTAAPAG